MSDKYLSIQRVADTFDVNEVTVRRALNSGKLKGFKVGGQWRITPEAVDVWIGA